MGTQRVTAIEMNNRDVILRLVPYAKQSIEVSPCAGIAWEKPPKRKATIPAADSPLQMSHCLSDNKHRTVSASCNGHTALMLTVGNVSGPVSIIDVL